MKNKVVSQLKKEIRNAELVNKVVAEEKNKPTKEDLIGYTKNELINEYEVFE